MQATLILLGAAFSGFCLDWLWVQCVASVHSARRLRAANLSVLIYLFTFVPTLLLIEKNFAAVVGYVVGGWFGTYLSVRKHGPEHRASDCGEASTK